MKHSHQKWPFWIGYLEVRFTRAKYYTSCGPLCRPTSACTYCINESSVHLVTSIISPNLDQVLSYLAHTLPIVCTPRKLFHYFTRRISWFLGQFSPLSTPLNFRPSHMWKVPARLTHILCPPWWLAVPCLHRRASRNNQRRNSLTVRIGTRTCHKHQTKTQIQLKNAD